MELDTKNQIIFEHLLNYARFSVKDLAKILRVSKAAIIKRINYLVQEQYLSRFDAIINWQKLPFIKKVYFVKVSGDTKSFEEKLLSKPEVFSIISLSGLYNYQVWCFFKNKEQEKSFEKNLRSYSFKFIKIHKLIFPKVSFFDVNLKLNPPEIEDRELKINPIDIAIMKYLSQGKGRESLYEMSKALNLPYDSVHYHAKNLFKAGYFQAFVAQPGSNKFTLQTTCLLITCKDKQTTDRLFLGLLKTPKILSDASGENNKLLVHFLSQNYTEYKETLSEILSFVPRDNLKEVVITSWDKIILNNRYPLEYFLEFTKK
jgi:DNA-binding Lrp family transcriptional regulator